MFVTVRSLRHNSRSGATRDTSTTQCLFAAAEGASSFSSERYRYTGNPHIFIYTHSAERAFLLGRSNNSTGCCTAISPRRSRCVGFACSLRAEEEEEEEEEPEEKVLSGVREEEKELCCMEVLKVAVWLLLPPHVRPCRGWRGGVARSHTSWLLRRFTRVRAPGVATTQKYAIFQI